MTHDFGVPPWVDLGATGLFAVTGAAVGIQRRFDYVGIFALAFATGVGGGILRDSVFLQLGPPLALSDWRYPVAVAVGTAIAILFARQISRIRLENPLLAFVEAAALGMYAAVGVQKTLDVELNAVAAIVIGVLNAVGGGVIRDVLAQRRALLFQPSQFYAVAALAGCLAFIAVVRVAPDYRSLAGTCTVIVTIMVRMLAVRFNWRTRSIQLS